MSAILTELSEWASTLPYWEQSALDQIVSGMPFTDKDYERLIQYLLEDEGLRERSEPRPPLQLPRLAKTAAQSTSSPVRLLAVSNLT